MDKRVIGIGLGALLIAAAVLGYNIYYKSAEPVPSAPKKAGPAEMAPVSPPALSPPEESPAPPVETGPTEPLEPPQLEETQDKSTAPPEKEAFGVLVAKFPTYQEASKLMAQLRQQGKPTYIQPSSEEPTQYEVWTAPYQQEEQAQAAAKSIKAKYGWSPRVERIEVLPPK
ncbi:MAG: SPOR domain-containing protein [Desulfobacteraceae bacterium]